MRTFPTSSRSQPHYTDLPGCLLATPAFPQTINGLADGQLQRQQQREEVRRRQDEATANVRLKAPVSSTPGGYTKGEKPCFVIRQVELDGDEAERFRWSAQRLPPRRLLGQACVLGCFSTWTVSAARGLESHELGRGFEHGALR
jgi:hypothetical protein